MPDGRPDVRWREYLRGRGTKAARSFEDDWSFFRGILDSGGDDQSPPPIWTPEPKLIRESNLGRAINESGFRSYSEFHQWSVDYRDLFWGWVIRRLGIRFAKEPKEILDLSRGATQPRWLSGARLNCADSCFDAEPEAVAVVSGSEADRTITRTTFGELDRLVNRIANGLVSAGFRPGEGIALYMPMTLECVAAYLAIVKAGCYVVSIADSFSAVELAKRIKIGNARGVITVESYTRGGKSIDLYQRVIEAHAPRTFVVAEAESHPPNLRDEDALWERLLSQSDHFHAISRDPYETTNVLFSSGTTGAPKAIPWNQLTPIKCAMDGHLHQDVRPSDCVAWPTNIGWMMGPWLIYASLINNAALALYEGTPSGKGFLRFVQDAGVTILGVVPSLVRAWQRVSDIEQIDMSRIRLFSSTGEPSNQRDYLWLMSLTDYGAPVIEYCGGTEIGGGYITGTVVQEASPATFTTPALGLDFLILDEEANRVPVGQMGEVFLVPPSIGLSQSLLNADHDEIYYEGCPVGPDGVVLRRHGDQLMPLQGGFYKAQGRADDTMNLGGIKVGSLELEQVINSHEAVYESAAVGVQPRGEGPERLIAYVVLREEVDRVTLRKELDSRIAKRLNPLFRIHDLVIVEQLPRTATNKLMRRILRKQYQTTEAARGGESAG